VTYIHTDGLGSPVARTNEKGELISRTRYEPYGATAGGATPGIGFTGHVNDPETGLTYMQQRYYDPLAGRFMSVDPVLTDNNTGASFNRYVYANNSPYRYIDPDGRDSESPYCLTGGGCNKYSGSSGSAGRNDAIATGAKIGAGAGVVVALICDAGTGGVCVLGNPSIVATGTLIGGIGGAIANDLKEKFSGGSSASLPPGGPDGDENKRAVTIDESRAKHIFREKEGHLADTPANRLSLENLANNPRTQVGVDKYGNSWHASTNSNGTQTWAQVRDGRIINGGLNNTARPVSPQSGLSSPVRPGK
jgi:RHS repeat-associated protein